MDDGLRQRGWSIHSSDNDHSNSLQQQRPRADTDITCETHDTLTSTDKIHLLNNAFNDTTNEDGNVDQRVTTSTDHRSNTPNSSDEGGGDDMLAMFGDDEEESEEEGEDEEGKAEPPKKRLETSEDNEFGVLNDDSDDSSSSSSSSDEEDDDISKNINTSSKEDDNTKSTATAETARPHIELTQLQQSQLDNAKNKLSKWAARLFDPNRPRGLVEAPQVIPLNDEFLTAFGKREKEDDARIGREIEIDKTSLDVIDVDSEDDDDDLDKKKKSKKKEDFSQMDNSKVKIANLSYQTTTATIARTCEAVGPVVDVNLILDDNGQSTGRAYVVFEDHETAVTFVEKMHEKQLEGRTLYIGLASSSGRKSIDPSSKKQESRYWERDISTKCNSCGEVGHIARNCPNEEKLKPCCLCAGFGHEMWSCPMKSVCFNCGLPGHVVRDCNQRRGLPQRRVCTICYRSGHHRFDCREWPWDAPSRDALCMQCGQKGHLMCNEMRWFFGLKGVTCFNCGEKGHSGIQCKRPDVDVCQKNPEVAINEIEMAGTVSLADQMSNQRSSRESRDNNNRGRQQVRSMPPPRNRDGYHPRSNSNSQHRRY